MRALVMLCLVAFMLGSETWSQPLPSPPMVGFSFSPLTSEAVDGDPAADLARLLAATEPDLVRLPVYWEAVQPTPDALDFSSVDSLLDVVAQHDLSAAHTTRVVLTVGARNFLYPELHEPAWAGSRQQPYLGEAQQGSAYREYFDASVTRYRDSPLLYAWQIENEPFDDVGNSLTGYDPISAAQLAWEVGEVHRIDPFHKAVVTSYDGWNVGVDVLQVYATQLLARLGGYPSGHPEEALETGDAMGLDIYLEGPSIPLTFTSVGLRAEWKQEAIDFWSNRARALGKDIWLAEMQAQPWANAPGGFTPSDLVASAIDYRQERLQVVLMWGVETWLQDPAWMSAAVKAMRVLRGAQPGDGWRA